MIAMGKPTEAMPPPRRTETLLLAASAALLCLSACKRAPEATPPPPPTVLVTAVTQADVPIYHDWIGVLDGLVNAHIRAQVTGYLQSQNYREGDPIKKGDLLFEIDPRPFQAALDQAKGQLAQVEARLGKTELDVKRYAPLVKDKAISQEEYDDAVQANLEAKAAVLSAKARVEQAQLNLEFTRITSPIDGIASIANGQIGDLVGPATGELTTVSTVDPIKVYYNVTEQAYINFTKLFSTESDRYERLRQLEIELILADGTAYGSAQNFHGGQGARSEIDGLDTLSFPSNCKVTAIEMFEIAVPVLTECKELIADSGGAG